MPIGPTSSKTDWITAEFIDGLIVWFESFNWFIDPCIGCKVFDLIDQITHGFKA